MAQQGGRRPGRIPADQVTAVTSWTMPEVKSSRVIKVTASKGREPGRVSSSAFANKSAPALENAARPAQAPAPTRAATTASQGYKDGYARGQVEGRKRGEADGFAKGEAEGFAKGEAAGRDAAAAAYAREVETQKRSLSALLAALQTPVQDIRDEMQAQLVPMIKGIAEAVLLGELRTHPEHIRGLVTAGLDAMPHGSSTVQVAVHPDCVNMIAGLVAEADTPVDVIADPALIAGSCRIHTKHTQLDSSLSKNLRRCLQNVFEGEPALAASLEGITEAGLKQTAQALLAPDVDAPSADDSPAGDTQSGDTQA